MFSPRNSKVATLTLTKHHLKGSYFILRIVNTTTTTTSSAQIDFYWCRKTFHVIFVIISFDYQKRIISHIFLPESTYIDNMDNSL
jgi:hypothetical protein